MGWIICDGGAFPEWLSWEDDIANIHYKQNIGSPNYDGNSYIIVPVVDAEDPSPTEYLPAGECGQVIQNYWQPANANRLKEGLTEGYHFSRAWIYVYHGSTFSVNWASFDTISAGFFAQITSM